uniref:ABC transporter domain-containing protein n=1 Tax=Rhabditophanes sp. KR3021 TaxID=114890 RepID=A0AC35UDM9_9BILA
MAEGSSTVTCDDTSFENKQQLNPLISQADPVTLTWQNLNVYAGPRHLLKSVGGIARPGECVALMGASGAGKTTLMNCIMRRNTKGLEIDGTILVNGSNLGRGITSVSAYVQQEDLFIGRLTVREHLLTQAYIRLPQEFTHSRRVARVNEVIEELDLTKCKNSKIGIRGVVKGISGGELKRLSFATEILTNPSLLFCDEPTTGLDSFMAAQVVKTLHRLARDTRKTIICTIHQPASEVFELFDRVIFLSLGQIAFQGPPTSAIGFFSFIGYEFPEHCNPADLFILYLALEPGKEEECTNRISRICAKYKESIHEKEVISVTEGQKANPDTFINTPKPPGIILITLALMYRFFLDIVRNPSINRAKFCQKLLMGLFIGGLYFRQTMNQDGVENIRGALYFYVSELTYSTCFGIQTVMPKDFALVVREYHDGLYPVFCYFLARVLTYIPSITIDGMIFVGVSYLLINLRNSFLAFFQTVITCTILEYCAFSFGSMISSLAPNYATVVSLSGPMVALFSITGGLFMNVGTLPPLISWVQYVSWFRYAYESLIISQFDGRKHFECQRMINETMVEEPFCLKDGFAVIDNLSFAPTNLYKNWGFMILFSWTTLLIGYLGLVIRVLRAR